MNITKDTCYFDFLSYCLDDTSPLPVSFDKIDWKKMMVWAERQSIVGVIFRGIQKAGKILNIPFDNLMTWIGYAQVIETQNKLVNNRCTEIVSTFQKDGFETCILKGQGNAMMYPYPLLRTPGDIDVWIRDGRSKTEDVRGIIKYVKERNPEGQAMYHHIDYGIYKEVEIEVHYRPSFMFNPIHNWRLQKWFRNMADGGCLMAELPEDAGSIRIPTREFNIIFQLSHVYNHLLHEGIGLRQIIDYFYVLKSNTRSSSARLLPKGRKNFTNDTSIINLLDYLGLTKIAGAMMWVLHEKLGLPKDYLIAPIDEGRGKVLLDEIMRGGNFGHYDSDNINATSRLKKNVQRIKRDLRLMRYFPSECIWEPWFRAYHLFWRMAH